MSFFAIRLAIVRFGDMALFRKVCQQIIVFDLAG
jgi:hypothetical protein